MQRVWCDDPFSRPDRFERTVPVIDNPAFREQRSVSVPQRIRVFVAIELPASVRGWAIQLQQSLSGRDIDVRWVKLPHVHLTLKFLGEVQDRLIPEICDCVKGVSQSCDPFSMKLSDLGAFPNIDNPRTLWIGVAQGSDQLLTLHSKLENELEKFGFVPESRRFTPHVTLGRIRNVASKLEIARKLCMSKTCESEAVSVKELAVMSSEISAEGPQYRRMGRAALR
mgnify:FL=1